MPPRPSLHPSLFSGATAVGVLEIFWEQVDSAAGPRFLESLVSLLSEACSDLSLGRDDGSFIADPEPAETRSAFRRGSVRLTRFTGGMAGSGWIATLSDERSCQLRLDLGSAKFPRWLQADPGIPSRLPILALSPGFGLSHAFVGLALKCGLFRRAVWTSGEITAEWSRESESGSYLADSLNGAVWGVVDGVTESEDPSGPVRFCVASESGSTADSNFLDDFTSLLSHTPVAWDLLSARCAMTGLSDIPLTVGPLDYADPTVFRSPLPVDALLAIRPSPERIVIQLDEGLPPDLGALALAHAFGHVALGHVRPGDLFGHWDTTETLKNVQRRWDHEVAEAFPEWFGVKGIESVDDLTARDKALLGLWRMIHETLGESSRLHPRAERYQTAAYQRQAAERLLTQLQQFGGAMLCDGVGLGKTYIATTLMVHSVNAWQDQRAEAAKVKAGESEPDLYRITVLAPNSVVSTWQREAIPPLYAFGVLPASVRVISHSKLSRLSSASEVLSPAGRRGLSDLEHLILSDLVIVDEAHNFRSADARRSFVLRDLLRLQPRKEESRRVLLLTATPVNNSLEDLRQQAALMFSRPIPLSDAASDDGYRRQALEEIRKRARKARTPAADKGNVAALMIHGDGKATFSKRLEFRDDLDLGTRLPRIGDYLNEQDKKLKEHQEEIRTRALSGDTQTEEGSKKAIRVADELLDRIVVQRSRALCKAIEREAGSTAEILFRPDAGKPEKLHYSDEYDGISDVLAGFLPLFNGSLDHTDVTTSQFSGIAPLSLKIYMWFDVREGYKAPSEHSPVVGLQRALVLKRLESSPVSLLITLLRLTVFHAFRLQQLIRLCEDISNLEKARQLKREVGETITGHEAGHLDKILSLATGDSSGNPARDFIARLARSHQALRPAAATDDAPETQLTLDLYGDGEVDEETQLQREQVERLWELREDLLRDFDTLLSVTPRLADIVFGKFDRSEWPHKFIAGGLAVDWPTSPAWGQRIVSDAKIRRLVARLVEARRLGQKAIVFSQFSDSLAYIQSVLRACRDFTRNDWSLVTAGLGVPRLQSEELEALLTVTEVITGETEGRDSTVNAFAPYYRIGPFPPSAEGATPTEAETVHEDWRRAWREAISRPIDVLLATDILAEGVNLQDAALLINFDIHWNPVRMIQRSGRIDRRLNPRIEHLEAMPEVQAIADELGRPVPRYYWHERRDEAPLTVNMILPDDLERELLLRERIAIKTLAIDFTLGLDQGTGAEADWMADYKFQGISSLNAFDKDRAIEQIAGYHEKLSHDFARRGIDRDWSRSLNVWIRQTGGGVDLPLVARATIGQKSGAIESRLFSRCLEPALIDGIPCWLWSEEKPRDSLLNQWLTLDGKTFPPAIRKGVAWQESASLPVSAHNLLIATRVLEDGSLTVVELPLAEVGRPLQQGITAVSAGYFGDDDSRRNVKIENFFVLQLEAFADRTLSA